MKSNKDNLCHFKVGKVCKDTKRIDKKNNYTYSIEYDKYNVMGVEIKVAKIEGKKAKVNLSIREKLYNTIVSKKELDIDETGWIYFELDTIYGIYDEEVEVIISLVDGKSIEICFDEFNNPLLKVYYLDTEEEVSEELDKVTKEIRKIYSSSGWAFLVFIYKIRDILLKIVKAPVKLCKKIISFFKLFSIYNIKRVINSIKNYGVKGTFYKIKGKLRENSILGVEYDIWYRKRMPSEEELEEQRNTKFDYEPKISIVVPTYNTKKQFLVEMIDSVVEQTYKNWELCIADGASTLPETLEVLKEYESKYSNIKVKYLNKNYMISENTNKALELVTGEYIGLFDHDDLLTKDALFEVVKKLNEDPEIDFVYSDEDKTDENTKEFFDPHFKPDWSPDTLRSYNYITHLSVFSKKLLDEVGNFDSEYDGAQDYDMFLRLTEKAKKIEHISKVLYHWRVHRDSTAGGISAKGYAVTSGKKALAKHLERIGEEGTVKDGKIISTYKVDYKIKNNPKVSIIIPNKDEVNTLKKCINSIIKRSTYENYEIIIVENNSVKESTFRYYSEIEQRSNIKVIKWEDEFNYSAINNFAVKQSTGEYVLLLNNDVEVINKKWIEEMLMHAQRKEIGVVGAKLYYPDDTIQHAGVILGIGSVAGHSHKYYHRREHGYAGRLFVVQNLSAVTAACLMIKRSIYDEVGGLDEGFKVAFNDIDFCMKVREKGYLCIFTPYTELYHYESKSRGAEDNPEKIKRFQGEIKRFEEKWGLWINDPYYNKNLTLIKEDFSLKED